MPKSVETSKDQKSIETSEGLQDKVWTRLKFKKVWKQVRITRDKSMDEAKAGSKIVKNEILEHL